MYIKFDLSHSYESQGHASGNKQAAGYTRLERDGSIAILTIDNLKNRNALSSDVRDGMFRHLQAMSIDKSCKVIVVTGAGGYFSSGADVGNMEARPADVMGRRAQYVDPRQSSQPVVGLMLSMQKPIITAVEGPAYGAGFSWAIASDYTVASKSARFCAAQVLRGLVPDGGLFFTATSRCGISRAREVLLSGRVVLAPEAEKIGLVHAVAPEGEALEVALELASSLAERPASTLKTIKREMRYAAGSLDDALRMEREWG